VSDIEGTVRDSRAGGESTSACEEASPIGFPYPPLRISVASSRGDDIQS
jgi:hypothetical protein